MGTPGADELFDTQRPNHYYGVGGAYLYIQRYFSDGIDTIIDFNPAEGDRVEVRFIEARSQSFRTENLSINRKGVVSWQMNDGRKVPFLGINRSDLKVEVDKRNNQIFLKFESRLRR